MTKRILEFFLKSKNDIKKRFAVRKFSVGRHLADKANKLYNFKYLELSKNKCKAAGDIIKSNDIKKSQISHNIPYDPLDKFFY